VYNIGSTDEISVNNLAKIITGKFGGDVTYGVDRNFNDPRYDISSDKLIALGWSQKVSLDDGIDRTIEWYRNNPCHWPEASIIEALGL